MESQQLLTQCKVLQNEVFAGLKSSDEPTDKVSKQHDHGKILPRVVKNLKRIERVGFRSHNFLAQLLSESMYNPGSTIKFREALEWFGLACWLISPEP